MGAYSTKSFFKKRLKEWLESDVHYFEVAPAPDCCPKCEEKANRKIAIASVRETDYPPFHKECRCAILPLNGSQHAGALNEIKAKYASDEFPMQRCPFCAEWIEGNARKCKHCSGNLGIGEGCMDFKCMGCDTPIPSGENDCPMCGAKAKYSPIGAQVQEPKIQVVTPVNEVHHYHHDEPRPQVIVAAPQVKKKNPNVLKIFFALFLIYIFIKACIPSPKPNPTSATVSPVPSAAELAAKEKEKKDADDILDAQLTAKKIVEKTLKAPATAKWPNEWEFPVKKTGNVFEVSGYVDAQNSFGALIRTRFWLTMRKNNNMWKLMDIKVGEQE